MSTNKSNVDQMLSFLEQTPEPGASTKTASDVDAPAAPAAPAAAPAASSVAQAAAKIASAEEEQMKTTAAAFGVEFAKAAEAHFKAAGLDFSKVAAAPGNAGGGGAINQAAVDAAFKAGMTKGAEDTVAAFRQGYADRLKVAHDLLTVTHMSGQAHGAALRKHASDVAAKVEQVKNGQLKVADANMAIADVLPFWVPEKPASAA